jgi:hypothetical protein
LWKLVGGNPGDGAGTTPVGNAFVLSFSSGLAGAAAMVALRLFVPGLAGLVSAVAAPLVCGGMVFVGTLLTLLAIRGGADAE